jgi:DNA mismatch repair protein MLH3
MAEAGPIKRLKQHTCDDLRAEVQIPSYASAVWELVANALDARSTAIAIEVNPSQGFAKVEDNGQGITRESLLRLGSRFWTSSSTQVPGESQLLRYYGCRGEALASLSKVSQVQVLSRAKGQFETYSVALTGSSRPPTVLAAFPRSEHGTTVTMCNFNHNQAVRRKELSANPQASVAAAKEIIHRRCLAHADVHITLKLSGSGAKLLELQKVRLKHARACPRPQGFRGLLLMLNDDGARHQLQLEIAITYLSDYSGH